jgi:ferredoxin
MENVIYYFSGRGNSLSVAKGLARLVSDTEIRPMSSIQGEAVLPGGRVGFVLPVIDFGIPAYVRDFLMRIRADGKQRYLFAVITCGGMPGASMMTVKKLLHRRGLSLSAGWILEFGRHMMTDGEWRIKLEEMAGAIEKKETVPLPAAAFKDQILTGLLNPIARLLIPKEDKKFHVDESCTGCGTCKRVCPVNNIQIENGKPVWRHKCQQCAACFSWCPQKAISGTCLAARTHYQNPRVRLEELFDQGGRKR